MRGLLLSMCVCVCDGSHLFLSSAVPCCGDGPAKDDGAHQQPTTVSFMSIILSYIASTCLCVENGIKQRAEFLDSLHQSPQKEPNVRNADKEEEEEEENDRK